LQTRINMTIDPAPAFSSTVTACTGAFSSAECNEGTAKKRHMRKKSPPSFVCVLVQALHPQACLQACHGTLEDEIEPVFVLEVVIPNILTNLEIGDKRDRCEALEDLQTLTDQQHAQNRVPLVCAEHKWDVMRKLLRIILVADNSEERRLACLIINNLSIPFDNKAVMCLGDLRDVLMAALLQTIRNGYPEAYLCCVCLMNLSILDDCKGVIVNYVPSGKTGACQGPLENTFSLLRTLEGMMTKFAPFLMSTVLSVEGEAIRWAIGLFRNLSTTSQNAVLIAQSKIPSLAARVLQNSPHPLCKWQKDSLEDHALAFLMQLVNFPESLQLLQRGHKELGGCLEGIEIKKGIHGMRAGFIVRKLLNTGN
jgi:hypothetical protein